MKIFTVLIGFNILISLNSQASVPFENVVKHEGVTLHLRGAALLEYSIFKIDLYELAYYRDQKKSVEILELRYKRDIKKEHSNKGWEVGFKQNLAAEVEKFNKEINWFYSVTPDMAEGDKLRIVKLGKNKTMLMKNSKVIASSENPRVNYLAYIPWLGPNPVDQEVKIKLLGESSM